MNKHATSLGQRLLFYYIEDKITGRALHTGLVRNYAIQDGGPFNVRSSLTMTMHSNIVLYPPWPPLSLEMSFPGNSPQQPIPYLNNPPSLINISIGRQLFVDEFLIGSQLGLTRVPNNLTIASKVGETEGTGWLPGVVFDQKWQGGMYRMFVLCRQSSTSDRNCLCHRQSTDGKTWESPVYHHIFNHTNIVLKIGPPDQDANVGSIVMQEDSWEVCNKTSCGPYSKFWFMADGKRGRPALFSSNNGIDWTFVHQKPFVCMDGCNMFYNPFRQVWSWSLREQTAGFMRRARRYWETASVTDTFHFISFPGYYTEGDAVPWITTTAADPPPRYVHTCMHAKV